MYSFGCPQCGHWHFRSMARFPLGGTVAHDPGPRRRYLPFTHPCRKEYAIVAHDPGPRRRYLRSVSVRELLPSLTPSIEVRDGFGGGVASGLPEQAASRPEAISAVTQRRAVFM